MRRRGSMGLAWCAAVCAAGLPHQTANAGDEFTPTEVIVSFYAYGDWTSFYDTEEIDDVINADPSEIAGIDLAEISGILVGFADPELFLDDEACYTLSSPDGWLQQFSMILDVRGCLPEADAGAVGEATDETIRVPLATFIWIPVTDGDVEPFSCLDVVGRVTTLGDFEGSIEFMAYGDIITSMVMPTDVSSLANSLEALVSAIGRFPLKTTTRDRLYDTPAALFTFGIPIVYDEPGEVDFGEIGDDDFVWTLGLSFWDCRSLGSGLDLDIDHYLDRAAQVERSALPDTR